MYPPRTMKTWLTTCASDGTSLRVGMKALLYRTARTLSPPGAQLELIRSGLDHLEEDAVVLAPVRRVEGDGSREPVELSGRERRGDVAPRARAALDRGAHDP